MAKNQYFLKDKKLDIYVGEKKTVMGVNTWTYSRKYKGLWCYYRQNAGGSTLTTSNTLKVYDSTERVIFVINRLPELRQMTLSTTKIYFNGRIYDINRVDDYEGYRGDYKLECEYSSTQSYNGIPEVEEETTEETT